MTTLLAYKRHKNVAKHHGIEFLLTFEEWSSIWEQSGVADKRGRGKGKYCMSRYGDVGPYSIDNVFINHYEQNVSDAQKGRKHSVEHKSKVGHPGNTFAAKIAPGVIEMIVNEEYIPRSSTNGARALGRKYGVSFQTILNIKRKYGSTRKSNL